MIRRIENVPARGHFQTWDVGGDRCGKPGRARRGILTALAAYQPIFLGVGIVCLAAGFWRVYRGPRAACAEGECGTPASNRLAKTALWLATVLIGLAVLFPYLAPLFLDV